MYTLYDYFRSTASYRVRIVLALKDIKYQKKEVHLLNQGGEQNHPDYQTLNPQKLVPVLVENEVGFSITQSLAIIDYLEAEHPSPSIYGIDNKVNAQIKSFSQAICCDIHPLNNLRVLNYLTDTLSTTKKENLNWYHHWLKEGFTALEKQLTQSKREKLFCFSDKVTLADVCLIPQWYNAQRFELDLSPYPILNSINNNCLTLAPFKEAMP